jgi:peroxiredoxin Q/BCP
MSKIDIGKKASADRESGQTDMFGALLGGEGSAVVVYFYPRDNTPGLLKGGRRCRPRAVQESQGLDRRHLGRQLEAHRKFKEKMGFPFELLSDPDKKVCKLYDVIQEKSMYGKKFMGIERSTFLIDDKGVLRDIWRKVKVNGHAAAVLAAVKAL